MVKLAPLVLPQPLVLAMVSQLMLVTTYQTTMLPPPFRGIILIYQANPTILVTKCLTEDAHILAIQDILLDAPHTPDTDAIDPDIVGHTTNALQILQIYWTNLQT